MTDKELIKQEIERRIENLKISLDKNCISEYLKLDICGNITTLYGLLEFIDSLPEEPTDEANCTPNDDLKKEISKWRNHYISILDNNLRID